MTYHKPVLLEESVQGLNIKPEGIYADLTFGGGGHSLKILEKLGKKGRLFGFDQDSDAIRNAPDDSRFTFVHSNFRFLKNFLRYYGIDKLDGILADLGISSHQIDEGERGFSYMKETVLDMRMNTGSRLTAAGVLNEYDEESLNRIFRNYGELTGFRNLTGIIARRRQDKKFHETKDFVEAIESFLPKFRRNKVLSKIFQALRIEVNDEMGALTEMLMQVTDVLAPGGRFSVISYHSLEDRLVKNFMKSGNPDGIVHKDFYGNPEVPFRMISKGVIIPPEKEIEGNPRARSAKLRIAEKI